VIFAIRNHWDKAPTTEGLSKQFAVIPFIESEAFGFTLPLPTLRPSMASKIYISGHDEAHADDEIQRMTLTFHHQVALDAPQTVLYWYHDSRS
jgi:hypothetical protein